MVCSGVLINGYKTCALYFALVLFQLIPKSILRVALLKLNLATLKKCQRSALSNFNSSVRIVDVVCAVFFVLTVLSGC